MKARRFAVLAVLVVGVLTTVATSQPRWEYSDTAQGELGKGEGALDLELISDAEATRAASGIRVWVEHPGEGAPKASQWTATIPGFDPQTRPLTAETTSGKNNANVWFYFSQGPCPEKDCVFPIHLEYAGDHPGFVYNIRVFLDGKGVRPPNGSFKLRQVMAKGAP